MVDADDMRISDIAQAAGTTPRAVRHYHRLGLLAEPRRLANGYREYDLTDLVRLMRIRWLASAGVPLGSVSSIVSATTDNTSADDLEADLTALIDTVEAERRVLEAKSSRLQEMLDAHRAGRPVSPLPPGLALVFADLVDNESDPAVRAEFEQERNAFELVAISGTAPEAFYDATTRLLTDAQDRDRIVNLYRRFAAVRGLDPTRCAAEIESLAEAMEIPVRTVLAEAGLLERWQSAGRSGDTAPIPVADLVPDRAQGVVLTLLLQRLGIVPEDAP